MRSSEQKSEPDRLRQFLTVFAIVGSFIINGLSNRYPIRGVTVSELSNNRFADVLVIPANYAFAIWGLIYLGLIGFAFYQFLPPAKQHPRLQTIRALVIVGSLAQAAWIFIFQLQQFALSLLAMIVLLLCLIGIYWHIGSSPRRAGWQERWLLRFPFSIYLGWITVATVVNVAVWLYDAGWQGGGVSPQLWTVILLGVSSVLALTLLWQRQDLSFALVIVWALVAIALRRFDIPLIAGVASVLAIALLIASGPLLLRQKPNVKVLE